MKIFSSLFHKNITLKLLVINILICIIFCLLTIVVFSSLHQVNTALKTVFRAELGRVVDNSGLGRDMINIMGETSNLVATFYGNDNALETRGKDLRRRPCFQDRRPGYEKESGPVYGKNRKGSGPLRDSEPDACGH